MIAPRRAGASLLRRLLVAAALALAASARAQEPSMNAAALAHALDRLAGTGRVLYVAAHPDDENTRLLAYLANHRHVTAAYLSMTRGGGGQNLIGTEQDELLDVVRTEELLAARALDGAQQRFTRMRDFGFSKSAAETLAIWGHDDALADVVWVMRTFQPDVVVTRFDEQPPNHGHHTASAILAREAFAAAADPTRFPEQIAAGAQPWQADRLLLNVPTWREGPPPADALLLDVGAYDPRFGLAYGELAARSRSQHKSQGFGVAGERGPIIERFLPLAGTRPERDPFEGIDLSWLRYGEAAEPLVEALDEARARLERDHPERAVPALLAARRALAALPEDARVRDARVEVDRILMAAGGLFARATAARPVAVPGSAVALRLEIVARQPPEGAPPALTRVVFPGQPAIAEATVLDANRKVEIERAVTVPADAPISAPYWLAVPPGAGRQEVADLQLVGAPEGPPALAVGVELSVAGETVRLDVPVVYAWTDPVHGERTRDFLVVPPATVTPLRRAVLFPNQRAGEVAVRVRAGQDDLRGDIVLPLAAGWRVEPARAPVALAHAGDAVTVRFRVTPPKGAEPIEARPQFESGGASWSWREDRIEHAHIPQQLVLQPAAVRLVPLALALPKGRIGYVAGSGDTVAQDLAHVGLAIETIDEETLRSGDLGRYAAIVVGIRAYNTSDAVRAAHERLMRWVEQGGTLVVQYNTNNRLAPLAGPIGPYPLVIGRERITDETAAMVALDPNDPILRAPNRLGDADFDGWVQERGLYFAESWDERYRPVFRSADPGEAPLAGGVLVARHGRGRYVYTGLSFFRQLPAGVPGAYRLLANLIGAKG